MHVGMTSLPSHAVHSRTSPNRRIVSPSHRLITVILVLITPAADYNNYTEMGYTFLRENPPPIFPETNATISLPVDVKMFQ